MPTYAVYWAYDPGGTLLYVGRTQDLIGRIEEHKREREWARNARWEYHTCTDLRVAMIWEREAIRAGNPVHNVQHKAKPDAIS